MNSTVIESWIGNLHPVSISFIGAVWVKSVLGAVKCYSSCQGGPVENIL